MCEWASKQTLDIRSLPRRDRAPSFWNSWIRPWEWQLNRNKACLEALLQFSPERVYIHLCGNDINIATTTKEIAENILDLVRYIKVNGVPDVMVGEILMRGGTFEEARAWQKKSTRRWGTELIPFCEASLVTVDGVHVTDSKLWKHAAQIRRALLRWQIHWLSEWKGPSKGH